MESHEACGQFSWKEETLEVRLWGNDPSNPDVPNGNKGKSIPGAGVRTKAGGPGFTPLTASVGPTPKPGGEIWEAGQPSCCAGSFHSTL